MSWADMSVDEQSDHLLELLRSGRGNRPVGKIYYIVCPATRCVKIGFTSGEVSVRIKALQTGSASELQLLAVRPGTIEDEGALHHHFRDNCMRGEWFKMSEHLFEHLMSVIWVAGSMHVKTGEPFPSWLAAGMVVVRDYFGELPDYFEERL